MRSLTLYQPYASFIANNYKQFETRSWGTSYRGPLLIHAAKKPITESGKLLAVAVEDSDEGRFFASGKFPRSREYYLDDYPLGCVVAIALLIDCIQMTQGFIDRRSELERYVGGWELGRFAWQITNIQKLDAPIPARGGQGLWIPSANLIQRIAQYVPIPQNIS